MTMTATVPQHIFERHLPSSPYVVGEELADQVIRFVQQRGLGYYPALAFFQEQGGVEKDLLDAAGHMSWFVCKMVREEVQRKLRPVFSSIVFDSIQTLAFTLPAVRPHQLNARHALVRHYRPDTVKVVFTASAFQRHAGDEALVKWARQVVYRWLKDSFHGLEITSAQLLPAPAGRRCESVPDHQDK